MIFIDPYIIATRNNTHVNPSIGKPGGGGGGAGGGTICPYPKAGTIKIIKLNMILLITILIFSFYYSSYPLKLSQIKNKRGFILNNFR